ncbi:MAG: lysophospholipid acyltransferase family protein [Ornithinimicrobium sp.]
MIYWVLKVIVVGPILRVLFRPWIDGESHVPARGGAILASNHLSFSDSIFLPLMVSRRITFPAKKEYFTGTGIKGWATKMFFTTTGQIPIDRAGGEASMVAVRQGMKVLRRGELFGIYPEGTRSPDGRLYRGKTGMARMALEAGVPIIPVAMIDTDKAQPTGQKIPNLHQVGMKLGVPMDFSRYAGQEEDRAVLRAITDEVMTALAALSGQEYVDEYSSVVKERIAAEQRARISAATKAKVGEARAGVEHAREHVRGRTASVAEQLSERFGKDDVQDAGDDPTSAPPDGVPQADTER